MSARHTHNEIKKVHCEECKTTNTMVVVLKGGRGLTLPAHSDRCKSDKIEFCCQRVHDGGYHYGSKCGRPVKGHAKGGHTYIAGVPLCGMHLSVERRMLEKYEQQRSAQEVASYLEDQMQAKVEEVTEATGVKAKLHYRTEYGSWKRTLDGTYILVHADQLIAAIEISVEVEPS